LLHPQCFDNNFFVSFCAFVCSGFLFHSGPVFESVALKKALATSENKLDNEIKVGGVHQLGQHFAFSTPRGGTFKCVP